MRLYEGQLTTKIMVALSTRCSKRIWVLGKALPLLGIIFPRLIGCQPIPDAGIDFRHLRFFNHFDIELGAAGSFAFRSGKERPRGVMRAASSGGPDLQWAVFENQIREYETTRHTTRRLSFG